MQEVNEQRIRENLTALVDLTSNVEDILKVLKDKDVINQDEEEKITTAGSQFDKKAQLYWLITKKDDAAFQTLISALRSTGNGEAADKLEDGSSPAKIIESPKTNGDGIGFDIEKEFERIQSEVESEHDQDHENHEEEHTPESEVASAIVAEVFQEALEKAYDQDQEHHEVANGNGEVSEISAEDNEIEAEVKAEVEATPPDSEGEYDAPANSSDARIHAIETKAVPEEKFEAEAEEIHNEPSENTQPEEPELNQNGPEVIPIAVEREESVKESKKQVQFESPRDESEESEPSISPNSKSIVQQNKELFEKSAPAGVKVQYNYRRSNDAPVEQPKESTVKNLKNFFQNLGSGGKSEGTKLGGANPNRKSLAS